MCKIWSYLITKKFSSEKFSFDSNVLSIQDLLNSNGQLLSFQEFKNRYACTTNFLQFYKVISAIPKYLVMKTRNKEPLENELYTANNFLFQLNDSTQIQLEKAKTGDFYGLLNRKIHTVCQELLQYLLEHDQCQERELFTFGDVLSPTTADAIVLIDTLRYPDFHAQIGLAPF